MGIGTSDGRYFEDEVQYQIGQPMEPLMDLQKPFETKDIKEKSLKDFGMSDEEIFSYGKTVLRRAFEDRARGFTLDNPTLLSGDRYDDQPTQQQRWRDKDQLTPSAEDLIAEGKGMDSAVSGDHDWNYSESGVPFQRGLQQIGMKIGGPDK